MKQTLVRIAVLAAAALVLSVYALYVAQNLPAITRANGAEETPDAPLGESLPARESPASVPASPSGQPIPASAAPSPDAAAPQAAPSGLLWQAVDRAEAYNGELQAYRPDNVSFDGGRILLTSRREDSGQYTSGMVTSRQAYLYGTFSFTIRTAAGKGLFPAIWLLPQADHPLPEIDLFEMIGSQPLKFYGVIHYGSASDRQREYFRQEVAPAPSHQVGLTWSPAELSWYLDGRCVFRTDKGVPQEYMYLIINQAIGGSWAGSPDDATGFPAVFTVESAILEPELSKTR